MPIVRLDNVQQFAVINVLSDPGYLPGPKIIPNACLVRINWNLTDGKQAHNVLYGQYSGTPPLSSALAESLRTAITTGSGWTTLAGFLASTTSLASVTLLDVRTSTGLEFTSTGAAAAGTSVGTALPDEVALAVTFRTLLRGPGGRGRAYTPGWASNATAAGGVVAPAAVTALNTWWQNLVNPQITAVIGTHSLGLGARQAYTSPITGRQFPARAAQLVPIQTLAVKDNHWDSQRRRGLK